MSKKDKVTIDVRPSEFVYFTASIQVRHQGIVITYAGMSFVASPQLVQASANYKSSQSSNEKEGGLGTTAIALICVFAALAIVIVAIVAVVVSYKYRHTSTSRQLMLYWARLFKA